MRECLHYDGRFGNVLRDALMRQDATTIDVGFVIYLHVISQDCYALQTRLLDSYE